MHQNILFEKQHVDHIGHALELGLVKSYNVDHMIKSKYSFRLHTWLEHEHNVIIMSQ